MADGGHRLAADAPPARSTTLRSRPFWAALLTVLVTVGAAPLTPTLARAPAPAVVTPVFSVGAAVTDFTPPCGPNATAATNCAAPAAGFTDPADCVPALDGTFNASRPFAFTEPYTDPNNLGHWDFGNGVFLDCPAPGSASGNGRWDGPFIGGGSNAPRFYNHVADPVTARAMVVSNGSRTIAIEVLDHEGVFNVYMAKIRALVGTMLPAGASLNPDDVFISATHDESAPDSLGLYGLQPVVSSVNAYWTDYMVHKGAQAIVDAYKNMKPAYVRFAEPIEPANMRQCFSSYPYIDDQLMPTIQAVDAQTLNPIVTLTDISQHTETLGFNGGSALDNGNTLDTEKRWITADWPYWFRHKVETDVGGVAIEMAGSVGSNETPEVFPAGPISRTPQKFVDNSHPAGCRTLYNPNGTRVPLGYFGETRALGEGFATAVEQALGTSSQYTTTSDVYGARADACVHINNLLFAVGGGAGIFASRPSYDDTCTVAFPPLANGSVVGTAAKTETAFFRIGDGEFVSIPGEVFPFTYLRGFVGPNDMACPDPSGNTSCSGSGTYPLPAWLLPHMHTPYRFINGLAEDMIGYIFPRGNGVGVPGEYNNPNSIQGNSTDRFGCGHSDDSEAASSSTADVVGVAAAALLDAYGGAAEDIQNGRYVLPDGSLSRDPLGGPEIKCNVDKIFVPKGPAVAVATSAGTVTPAHWMSLSGRLQDVPDRNTRGYIDANGTRHWLEVFPDFQVAGATSAGGGNGVGSGGSSLPAVSGVSESTTLPNSSAALQPVAAPLLALPAAIVVGLLPWRRRPGNGRSGRRR
ncbi:MAG TPA: hypothetical protein VG329_08750 [Candidatus Dormibacteraeota bacterium]|nr:hypothetical protein [Candidatus Dormibacteraeota bacterium]